MGEGLGLGESGMGLHTRPGVKRRGEIGPLGKVVWSCLMKAGRVLAIPWYLSVSIAGAALKDKGFPASQGQGWIASICKDLAGWGRDWGWRALWPGEAS